MQKGLLDDDLCYVLQVKNRSLESSVIDSLAIVGGDTMSALCLYALRLVQFVTCNDPNSPGYFFDWHGKVPYLNSSWSNPSIREVHASWLRTALSRAVDRAFPENQDPRQTADKVLLFGVERDLLFYSNGLVTNGVPADLSIGVLKLTGRGKQWLKQSTANDNDEAGAKSKHSEPAVVNTSGKETADSTVSKPSNKKAKQPGQKFTITDVWPWQEQYAPKSKVVKLLERQRIPRRTAYQMLKQCEDPDDAKNIIKTNLIVVLKKYLR